MSPEPSTIRSGIEPLDTRGGGLTAGGTYLVVGAPGPEKMVAALQFVSEGVRAGERCALIVNTDAEEILSVAAAWGFDLRDEWETGQLQIVGFKDDFELRALRSIAPEEVVEELEDILAPGLSRIAVDPGGLFLTGGARTLLGSAFLTWARGSGATILATFSVDGGARSLPSSADWLVHATTGRLLLERRDDGLYQVTLARSIPDPETRDETISLELRPGLGLTQPDHYPSRRGVDRGQIDEDRLLLVSLGGEHSADLETWARATFETAVVTEPFDAIAEVQSGTPYGSVLIHASRRRSREALQACRAIRPLTRAAIIVASDDSVRATDRIHVLEAGADDFLSGGIDFRELGLRTRQAMARGARPASPVDPDQREAAPLLPPPEADHGRVPHEIFVAEIERRAADPDLSFFCVLDVKSATLAVSALEEELTRQVRLDEGDLVTSDGAHCAVLLQGAREGHLGPFLARLASRLDELDEARGDAGIEVDVLSHPADAERISALLESSGGRAA